MVEDDFDVIDLQFIDYIQVEVEVDTELVIFEIRMGFEICFPIGFFEGFGIPVSAGIEAIIVAPSEQQVGAVGSIPAVEPLYSAGGTADYRLSFVLVPAIYLLRIKVANVQDNPLSFRGVYVVASKKILSFK